MFINKRFCLLIQAELPVKLFHFFHYIEKIPIQIEGILSAVVANGQDYDIVLSEFESHYVFCRSNILGKSIIIAMD